MTERWVPLLLLLATSCVSTSTTFKPYTSQAHAPMLDWAIEFYEGDIPLLTSAGAVVVGTVYVDGNRWADDGDLRSDASREAARRGGTHYIVGLEQTSVSTYRARPEKWTTTVENDKATTVVDPGLETVRRRHGSYVVVRVEYAQWMRLPPALVPVPGRHYRPAPTRTLSRPSP